VPAQYELARRLRVADGVPLDLSRSLHYYRLAAQAGNQDAQFSLGVMLEQGIGLKASDPAQASMWYRKLAQEHAHAGAAHNLGVLYVQGLGVPKNGAVAKTLFEYAVSLGSHDALYSLGLQLLRGEGTERDPLAAATLALVAAARQPGSNGSKLLEAAMRELSPQQAAEARSAAPQWKPQHVSVDWDRMPAFAAAQNPVAA
jgi:TPR repeat protein